MIIDHDADKLNALGSGFNGRRIKGVEYDSDNLIKAGVEQADVLIAVSADDNINITGSLVASKIYNVPQIIARVNDPDKNLFYHKLGIDTINPIQYEIEMLRSKMPIKSLDIISTLDDNYEIVEFIVAGNAAATDATATQSTEAEAAVTEAEAETETNAADSTGGFVADESLSGVEISFLNSKGEIQAGLEDMAVQFEEETGISVDIMACGTGEVPYTKITSAYNSGTAPTMAMLDTTDVVALAEEYALDLSNETWTAECADQLTKINGTVYSFPFCIEGRGLIYNKSAIEDTLGKDFDASTINSYDSLKALLEELRAKGMEDPVVISKEDWSLGAHQLGFIYDTYDGTTDGSAEIISKLESGEVSPEDYDRFNEFVDTLDLLLEYNINGDDPLGALYEQDPIFLADGDAAIWANGCWAWPNIEEAGASTSDEYGFLPFVLGNDTTDFANTGIQAAPSKQVMIDKVQATEEEQAAAKEFLSWMVYAESGQKSLVESCAIIPACSNNAFDPLDPLGIDIKEKMTNGNTYSSSFIAPSDHWSVMGAAMQKYIAGESSKDELAQELADYWTSQE